MALFPKFDALAVLAEIESTPAKAANPAKVTTHIPQNTQNFSRLATLAAPDLISAKKTGPQFDPSQASAETNSATGTDPVAHDLNDTRLDARVTAWCNANPPELPVSQNHCAACGEFIPVYENGWVYLADGALIHYGKPPTRCCFDEWQTIRRAAGCAGLTAARKQTGNSAARHGNLWRTELWPLSQNLTPGPFWKN